VKRTANSCGDSVGLVERQLNELLACRFGTALGSQMSAPVGGLLRREIEQTNSSIWQSDLAGKRADIH
jgi:hypothetical protein